MAIQRKRIDAVKAEAQRLLQKIDELERCAGWHNYRDGVNEAAMGKKQPDDTFESGMYTAAVKRSSMDLSRALVELRR